MNRTGFCHWRGDTLELNVRVQPGASRDEIAGAPGGDLKVRITTPPVEGKANAHLIRFLARTFGVPPARVTLISGAKGRSKRLRIEAPARLPEVISENQN